MCCTILSASSVVAFNEGPFTAGFPSPAAPWQPAHFDLYSAAPSSAANAMLGTTRSKPRPNAFPTDVRCFISLLSLQPSYFTKCLSKRGLHHPCQNYLPRITSSEPWRCALQCRVFSEFLATPHRW